MLSFEDELFRDPPNEADEEARRGHAIREHRKDEFLRAALEEPAGRLWFWDQLAECNLFTLGFVAGAPDETAFALGRRSIGVTLYERIMRVMPESYFVMRQENNE